MPRRTLSPKEGARLRLKIFFFARKQKADSEGWIHGLALLVRKEFELGPFQASHHLDVLVQEGRLVRKTKASSLYRVAANGGDVKPKPPKQKAGEPLGHSSVVSHGGKSALARVASQPGFQKWLETEIAKVEADLKDLKTLRR